MKAFSRVWAIFSLLFSRRWWWSTLLVMTVMLVMTRLGFWQLERGTQRRLRNDYISERLAADPLPLLMLDLNALDIEQFALMEVTVRGTYDHTQQVILHGQIFRGEPGVNIITPLVLPSSEQAVLVNRGWIPYDLALSSDLSQFDELGSRLISGRVRLSENIQTNVSENLSSEKEWYSLDIGALQRQMTYNLMPVYLQQIPQQHVGTGGHEFPKRVTVDVELNDGPHLGYAIQWFIFVPLLGGGYLHSLRKSASISEPEIS